MKWLALALAITLNASANIFMKAAMRQIGPTAATLPGLLKVVLNPYLVCGVLSFGLALGAYSYTLTAFPLSVAYPVMTSLGLLIVATASLVMFQESFPPVKIAGSLLILVGVVLVARS